MAKKYSKSQHARRMVDRLRKYIDGGYITYEQASKWIREKSPHTALTNERALKRLYKYYH